MIKLIVNKELTNFFEHYKLVEGKKDRSKKMGGRRRGNKEHKTKHKKL